VKRPILVIQMQRMGDLILSFPLFLWLERAFPGHPVWVMAEPAFARPLARLSPRVRYLPYGRHDVVMGEKFHLVLNLSHRRESMELAGRLQCDGLVGGYVRDGVSRVAGDWQEYRMSLIHNNRHNRFHWADLNALDVVPLPVMAATRWPAPRVMPPDVRTIGLFLGASEPDKRPSAAFWAGLVGELERRDWTPVLLGGPGEKDLCREVLGLAGRPVASACGTLGLDQFAVLGQTLAALVTPDTGPMHLAAWSGLKVLNLSMGPVHAWETGPYQPGHAVLRSSRDCVGCWRCRFERPRCQDLFSPARVAGVLEAMLRGGGERLRGLRLPGLEIHASGRLDGLYDLKPLSARPKAGQLVGAYWRAFWMHAFGAGDGSACHGAASELRASHAPLVRIMTRDALRLLRTLATSSAPADLVLDWGRAPLSLRPLSGYCAAHLANHDASPASRKRALALAEGHLRFLSETG
jgi:ADP-heptose:LPS heptosyltransferase